MISELGLVGGCGLEPLFPLACSEVQKRLFVSVCFSPHPGTRPYMREGVKYDMHIELKYCKFKLLGKLVVQHTKNK